MPDTFFPMEPHIKLIAINSSQRRQATWWATKYAIDHASTLNCEAVFLDLRGKTIRPCTQKLSYVR
ncbi:MAG: hypothetical protein ACTSVM_06720 [Candidatus Ranarchaeia archaeon]